MTTIIGSLPATQQDVQQRYKADGSKTVRYVVNTTDESTFLGSYSIGTSVDDGLYLAEINVTRNKGASRIDMLYVTAQRLTFTYGSGDNEYKSSNANVTSRSIWAHPGCDNPTGYVNNEIPSINGTEFPGVDNYFTPNVTYTLQTSEQTFSFSESNVLDNVGKPGAPDGMTSANGQEWLKVAKEVSENGELFSIRETWQHAGYSAGTAETWPVEIYGTAV